MKLKHRLYLIIPKIRHSYKNRKDDIRKLSDLQKVVAVKEERDRLKDLVIECLRNDHDESQRQAEIYKAQIAAMDWFLGE